MIVSSQDIGDFLSQNKTVSLEKIGLLDINGKEDKDIFIYDKHAETSPELLQYLSEKKGKSLSIISQDTEYFLDQSRQLMNIRAGNLIIGDIGYIYANNAGAYAFSSDSSEVIREADKKTFEDVYAKSPLTSSVNYAAKRNRKPWRIIAAVIVIGAIIAYATFYIRKTPALSAENKSTPETVKDSAKAVDAEQPGSRLDSLPAVPKTKGYKFVIQTFDDALSCQKRSQQLKNYGNEIFKDTVDVSGKPVYRLYVTDTSALAADTTHIKDSLRSYFGYPVSVE